MKARDLAWLTDLLSPGQSTILGVRSRQTPVLVLPLTWQDWQDWQDRHGQLGRDWAGGLPRLFSAFPLGCGLQVALQSGRSAPKEPGKVRRTSDR